MLALGHLTEFYDNVAPGDRHKQESGRLACHPLDCTGGYGGFLGICRMEMDKTERAFRGDAGKAQGLNQAKQ